MDDSVRAYLGHLRLSDGVRRIRFGRTSTISAYTAAIFAKSLVREPTRRAWIRFGCVDIRRGSPVTVTQRAPWLVAWPACAPFFATFADRAWWHRTRRPVFVTPNSRVDCRASSARRSDSASRRHTG